MENKIEEQASLVISYLTLRRVIGILGMSLPFIVSLGARLIFGTGLQSSVSSYYHTDMRDVLVGILFAIGFFLLSYKGYEVRDDLIGDLACLFAIGVALFPTTPDGEGGQNTIGYVHMAFAGLFFMALTYFSLFLFTKTNPNKTPTKRKLQRNKVYKICGAIMAICIFLMSVYSFLPDEMTSPFDKYAPTFWLEALAILAFGVSWFVKGETLLKDEVEPTAKEKNERV